ncbi:MAG TPA: hypothetical protein VFC38_09305 [Stellaceae bacterium]|nr:hypothetical protein [Stellaceae bacterium]
MTRKPIILAGLCVALLAAPAFAQSSDTSPSQTNHMSGAASAKDDSAPSNGGPGGTRATGSMPVTQAQDRDVQESTGAPKTTGSQGSAQMEQKKGSGPMARTAQQKHKVAQQNRTVSQQKRNMAQQNQTMSQQKRNMASNSRSCYNYAWQSQQMNDCLARNPQQAQSASNMSNADQNGAGGVNGPRGQYGNAPSPNNPNGKGPAQ